VDIPLSPHLPNGIDENVETLLLREPADAHNKWAAGTNRDVSVTFSQSMDPLDVSRIPDLSNAIAVEPI
jgi:hypothetical protein